MIALHYLSEILKYLNRMTFEVDTVQHVMMNVIKILVTIDKFVQFILMISIVLIVKNSFASFLYFIKLAVANPASYQGSVTSFDFYLFVYFPNGIFRIYTIVNQCSRIMNEVNLSCDHHELYFKSFLDVKVI